MMIVYQILYFSVPAELEMEVENSALTMEHNTGTSSKRLKTTKEEENVTMATTEFRESFTMETSSLKEENEGLDLYERVKVLANVVKKGLHDFQHNVDQTDLTPTNETHVHEPPVLDNEKGVVNDTPLEAEKSSEDIEKMEKLRKAIAKMRRLDTKLADVMKVCTCTYMEGIGIEGMYIYGGYRVLKVCTCMRV